MVKIAPQIDGETPYNRNERLEALNAKARAVYDAAQPGFYAACRAKYGPRNPQNARAFDALYARLQMEAQPIVLR